MTAGVTIEQADCKVSKPTVFPGRAVAVPWCGLQDVEGRHRRQPVKRVCAQECSLLFPRPQLLSGWKHRPDSMPLPHLPRWSSCMLECLSSTFGTNSFVPPAACIINVTAQA